MKIDIRKTYDWVEWDFFQIILKSFNFPSIIMEQIMESVTTARFSVSINGELEVFFFRARLDEDIRILSLPISLWWS